MNRTRAAKMLILRVRWRVMGDLLRYVNHRGSERVQVVRYRVFLGMSSWDPNWRAGRITAGKDNTDGNVTPIRAMVNAEQRGVHHSTSTVMMPEGS